MAETEELALDRLMAQRGFCRASPRTSSRSCYRLLAENAVDWRAACRARRREAAVQRLVRPALARFISLSRRPGR
jgi:hypothetical protein